MHGSHVDVRWLLPSCFLPLSCEPEFLERGYCWDLSLFLVLAFLFYFALDAVFGYHVSQVTGRFSCIAVGSWCSDFLDGLDGVGSVYVSTAYDHGSMAMIK